MKEAVQTALQQINDCRQTMQNISDTCCDPGRSPAMQKIFALIDGSRQRLEQPLVDQKLLTDTDSRRSATIRQYYW